MRLIDWMHARAERRWSRELAKLVREAEVENARAVQEFTASPPEKRELTEHERAIIEFGVAQLGSDRGAGEAQLARATYGGRSHAGTHVCFRIDLPDDVPLLRSAISSVDFWVVPHGRVLGGEIELGVDGGRIAWLYYTEYHKDDELSGTAWPETSRITAAPPLLEAAVCNQTPGRSRLGQLLRGLAR